MNLDDLILTYIINQNTKLKLKTPILLLLMISWLKNLHNFSDGLTKKILFS